MLKRTFISVLLAVLFWGLLTPYSYGQKYPSKPVEIIVPFTAGAPMDIVSRLVAETAPKYLGQPIVVINKPGAAGSIAAGDIISSKPDGYKFFHSSNLFFSMTTKTQKIPFDPKSISPLVNFSEYIEGVVVRSDSPWKTFNDLLDYARKNPGKLRWAHVGRGMFEHVVLLVILRKAGLETIDIPYKGAPEKVAALLGGHLDASTISYGTAREHLKSGAVRLLMVFSNRRYSILPDIPCADELGFPEAGGFKVLFGYYIHKDTPEEIKKTLMDVLKKTFDDPGFKREFEKLGDEPRFGGPEFMMESIKKTEDLSVPVLKELGLYVEK